MRPALLAIAIMALNAVLILLFWHWLVTGSEILQSGPTVKSKAASGPSASVPDITINVDTDGKMNFLGDVQSLEQLQKLAPVIVSKKRIMIRVPQSVSYIRTLEILELVKTCGATNVTFSVVGNGS